MIFFKILWVIDALASLIILYFFFVGLADGTVSSRNAGLWTIIVLALAGIMCGSIWLRTHGYNIPAILLLLVIVLPALFYALYILIAVLDGGRMN
jgi:hypothetical protein